MSDTPEWTARFVYGEETLDALRRDAERYRWLRTRLSFTAVNNMVTRPWIEGDDYARSIDERIDRELSAADRDGAANG